MECFIKSSKSNCDHSVPVVVECSAWASFLFVSSFVGTSVTLAPAGDYRTVTLLRKTKIEKFNFDEIYPFSSRVIEKTPLRSKIQQWLTVLDEELKLKEVGSGVRNKLTKGTYCYNSGAIYTNCFEIK